MVIAGSGFGSGIEITFGGQAAQSIALISSSQVKAVTPPGAPGPTDVVASLGSQEASLDGGYSYDAAPPIDYCVLQFPKSLDAAPNSSAGPVYGRVYVPNVTTVAGNESEIQGQVGWGPLGSVPDSNNWDWSQAAFNASCSQCGNNYEFDGSLYTGGAGSYALAFRFSTDQGNSWTNCDATGDTAPATYEPANQGTLTVAVADGGSDGGSDAGPSIGYCDLQFPSTLNSPPGVLAGPVYGRVYVAGLTDSSGNPALIEGQVGFGPPGSIPASDGGWSWAPAAYNPGCNGCGNNYEYDGTFTAPGPGSYALAFRFSLDNGGHFIDCDAAGDAPYNPSNGGVLTVEISDAGQIGPDAGPSIGWCDLQFPSVLDGTSGLPAGPVYGRVYVAGVTDSSGSPNLIEGQVGYGPPGSIPASDGGWTWASAAYNSSCSGCGNNYEYDAYLTAPAPGSYALAYRFSLDHGVSFVDCDALGDFPYDPANEGTLTATLPVPDAGPADAGSTVDAGPTYSIGWCDLQFPTTLDGTTGSPAGPVYGRVYVAGLTDSGGDAGEILGEVGFGPLGGDPTSVDAGWRWAVSAYNPSCSGCGNNYEYDGTLTAPSPGNYALAYRFSVDQGASFTDCDSMGDIPYNPEFSGQFDVAAPAADAGPDAGVDAGGDAGPDGGSDAGPVGTDAGPDAGVDAGPPDAGPVPITIQYCDLQFPTSLTLEPGASTGLVYAQVYSSGVTSVAGNQADILAQVGYGPAGSDPAAADAGWSWSPAAFNASCLSCGNNYEYDGAFAAPGVGSYDMAARFSGDQGATWTNCDAAGDAVYNPANAGTLTTRWIAVGWCNVQFPPALSGTAGLDAGPIYGQVYWAGVTDSAGNPASILAEVGLGPTGSDPTASGSGWTWWPAEYNPSCLDCGNNYEYFGYVVPPASGSYDYVTRFSADDGGYWTACSLDGPWVEGGVNDAGLLTVQ